MLCSVMNGFMYCRRDKKECRSSAPVIYILGIDSNFFHQHKTPFHGKQCKTTSKKCVLVGWAFEERAGIRMSAAKRAISGVQKLSLHRRRWKRALEWRRQAGCLSAALTTCKKRGRRKHFPYLISVENDYISKQPSTGLVNCDSSIKAKTRFPPLRASSCFRMLGAACSIAHYNFY